MKVEEGNSGQSSTHQAIDKPGRNTSRWRRTWWIEVELTKRIRNDERCKKKWPRTDSMENYNWEKFQAHLIVLFRDWGIRPKMKETSAWMRGREWDTGTRTWSSIHTTRWDTQNCWRPSSALNRTATASAGRSHTLAAAEIHTVD